MDMSQYKNLFLSEAREYLRSINETVVALEEAPAQRPVVDALFRAAHSLKGMAASMEYGDVVEVAHSMEDLMIRVREEQIPFDAGVADLLLEGTDLIDGLLCDVEKEVEPRRPVGDFALRIAGYTPKPQQQQPEAPVEKQPPPPEPPQSSSGEGKEHPGEITTVRIRTELLDQLINLTGELITNKNRLMNIGRELSSPALNETVSQTEKLLRALHGEVMQVRLMPFEAICDRFQRSVRSLAKRSGKELHLEIEGRDIGLDRAILEQLIDPLNHILRNAVDHGLEPGGERIAAGKPARGLIKISVSRDRDRVVVTVSDDGRGMEPQKLVAAAVAKGVINPQEGEGLSERQALMLICIPGFSTAKEVTDISGRGVGMDAVDAAIQKLGGTLAIESEPGVGSRFILRLPMTIAIIHALVVQCGGLKVGIPVNSVQRTVELRRAEVSTVGKRQVFQLGDEAVPLLSLNRVLALPLGRFRSGFLPLFVTEVKGRRVGMVVDRLCGQHELFVKPLGRPLGKLHGVAGGATLGDGEVITILDLGDLL
jgi:two-component system, chemotaxis family, sensor kinase CheA